MERRRITDLCYKQSILVVADEQEVKVYDQDGFWFSTETDMDDFLRLFLMFTDGAEEDIEWEEI